MHQAPVYLINVRFFHVPRKSISESRQHLNEIFFLLNNVNIGKLYVLFPKRFNPRSNK